jgi:hypothetical protein
VAAGTIPSMATKERVIQLIDSLPDTPETESRLDAIEHELEPNGLSEDDAMLVGHEAAIERLRADPAQWASWQAEIAELDGTLADGLSGL